MTAAAELESIILRAEAAGYVFIGIIVARQREHEPLEVGTIFREMPSHLRTAIEETLQSGTEMPLERLGGIQ